MMYLIQWFSSYLSPVHLIWDLGNLDLGIKWCFDPVVVIFFEINFFHFQKKLQVLADPVVVIFFEMHLIQHL